MNLTIIVAMVDAISNPLMTLVQATGKVKSYQLVIGSLLLLNLPISWILLKSGFTAEYTIYVAIFLSLLSLYARLLILKKLVSFNMVAFFYNTLFRMLLSTVACYGTAFFSKGIIYDHSHTVFSLFGSVIVIVLISIIVLYYIGFNKEERSWINQFGISFIKRK